MQAVGENVFAVGPTSASSASDAYDCCVGPCVLASTAVLPFPRAFILYRLHSIYHVIPLFKSLYSYTPIMLSPLELMSLCLNRCLESVLTGPKPAARQAGLRLSGFQRASVLRALRLSLVQLCIQPNGFLSLLLCHSYKSNLSKIQTCMYPDCSRGSMGIYEDSGLWTVGVRRTQVLSSKHLRNDER
ncbi:hypothetical protein BDQ17DRAFT_907626 [Cyathus striatus]|nr:hypothetical protein BDQ17DRAFT_907626 [Cyathus striatus]